MVHDQLSWTKPELSQLKEQNQRDEDGNAVELVSYLEYLNSAFPTNEGEQGQNEAIIYDRLLSFARPGGLGAKFKNTYEKMLKALQLPKGAKEELDFPPEIAEKILKGEPLWEEEEKVEAEEEEEEEEENSNKLSLEQKMKMTMFGEGRYHLTPSFFRTLIQLKKQKREFAVVFRTFGSDLD